MTWNDPQTWVALTDVTADDMNREIRDNFDAIGDPWTAYNPTWTASTTNPTLGNGTLVGAYMQAGKLIHFRLRLTIGSTTNVGSGAYSFGLPVPCVVGFNWAFAMTAVLQDAGSGRYTRAAYLASTTTFVLTDASGVNVTHASPFAPANGDTISVAGTYEAA